jgi:hypothetical protein
VEAAAGKPAFKTRKRPAPPAARRSSNVLGNVPETGAVGHLNTRSATSMGASLSWVRHEVARPDYWRAMPPCPGQNEKPLAVSKYLSQEPISDWIENVPSCPGTSSR